MEFRVISRGAFAGAVAGILGFIFTRIFAEPLVDKAIDYESGRGEILNALRKAAGQAVEEEGPEIFSRTIQSTVGVATGVIAMSIAMGILVAVVFLLLHGRFSVRPRTLAWGVAAYGFLGVFLLPFAKYPANPPAVGHDFTIANRGAYYLSAVGVSLVLLALALLLVRALRPRWGSVGSAVAGVVALLAAFGVFMAVVPSFGDLKANVAVDHEIGYAQAATETPQPIVNTYDKALTIDDKTYAPGQLVYPGFDADLMWSFRWYSILNQMLIWSTIALIFGAFVDRLTPRPVEVPARGERVEVA